jgi:hypothetical protein
LKKIIDHSEYEEILTEVRAKSHKSQDEIAQEGVPKLYWKLKKLGYEIEDARSKTVRDLRKDPGWAEDTIMHWMPDEAKDAQAQKNGLKGGEETARRRKVIAKHEVLISPE